MKRRSSVRVSARLVAFGVVLSMLFGASAPADALRLRAVLDAVLEGLKRQTQPGSPLRVSLDTSVRTAIDGVAKVTVAAAPRITVTSPGTVIADPIGSISGVGLLEPLDGVIEDVVHPDVLEPVAEAINPAVEALQPVTEPLGEVVEPIETTAYGVATDALKAVSLDPAAYVVRTTYRSPDGTELVKVADAVIDVPRELDVDDSGLPDITTELRFLTARPSLRVSRLPTATGPLPVAVEAIVAPDGWDAPGRIAIGIDALDTEVPEVFRATLADDGRESGTLAAELHSVGPRDHLAVTAASFTEGPGGAVVDPQRLRAKFTPMPSDVTLRASAPGADVLDGGRVELETSEPTVLEAAFESVRGDDASEVGVLIDRVPGAVSLAVGERPGNGVQVAYTASGPVDRVVLSAAETVDDIRRSVALGVEGIQATAATISISPEEGLLEVTSSAPIAALTLEVIDPRGIFDRATELRARAEGLPQDLTATVGPDGTVGFSAGSGVLGLLELQLTSGPDLALPATTDGLLVRDDPSQFVVFVRLTGLRSVSLEDVGSVGFELLTVGGRPFTVDAVHEDDAGRTAALLTLSALPELVRMSVEDGADGAVVEYAASAVVSLLEARLAQRPSGSTERALDLRIHDLPEDVTATIDETGLHWEASSVVPLLEAEITDPGGLADRVDRVVARLQQVPEALDITIADGGFTLDAPSGPVGVLELLATNTDDVQLADDVQGILVRDLPETFSAFARLTNLSRASLSPDPAVLDLRTVGRRPIVVDLARQDAQGAGFSLFGELRDLPEAVTLGFAAGDATALDYHANAVVSSLVARITTTDADGGRRDATLNVTDLPQDVQATIDEDGLHWSASGVVPLLVLEVDDAAGVVDGASHLLLRVSDLPRTLTADVTEGAVLFEAGAGESVGLLEAQIDDRTDPVVLSSDGVFLSRAPESFTSSIRVTGLRGLSFDPVTSALGLRTLGGTVFTLDVEDTNAAGDLLDVAAVLDALPADVEVALGQGDGLSLRYRASEVMDLLTAEITRASAGADPSNAVLRVSGLPTALDLGLGEGGELVYEASGIVPRLELDATDPNGFLGRASALKLRVDDLPTALAATVADDGTLAVDATNEPVGRIEAAFSDGDEVGLAGDDDGAVLIDTPAAFAVYVRLHGLRGIGLRPQADSTTLDLRTGGDRVFRALVEQADGNGSSSEIDALLNRLPADIELTLDEDDTGRAVGYSASGPMDQLLANVTLTDADGTNTFSLDAQDLPTELALALRDDGAITLTGSSRTGSLAITAVDPAGIFAAATLLQAQLVDVPTSLSVVLGEDGTLRLDAPEGLGLLEALATSGPMLGLAPDLDGIRLVDDGDEFVAFVRVHDLRQVALQPAPVSLTVGSTSGRDFVVLGELAAGGVLGATDGTLDLGATISPLPGLITLAFEPNGDAQVIDIASSQTIDSVTFDLLDTPAGGTPLDVALLVEDVPSALRMAVDVTGAVQYTASAPVPLLALDAIDPAGLFDRATDLHLRLENLPTALDVALSDTGAVNIDGHGGTLGLMDILITTGPDRRVPNGFDGIRFEDLTDLVVSARFTNLKLGQVAQVPRPKVLLNTSGGRPLSLLLLESAPGKPGRRGTGVAYTEATLANLPTTVDLELLEGAAGALNIDYEASQTASSLTFETNSGDKWVTQATITNPVPARFKACQTDNTGCLPVPNPPPGNVPGSLNSTTANIGSFSFVASQHTTLNVWDCSRPLTATCNPNNFDGAQIATHVNNLRVKTLHFAGHINQGTVQSDGRLYANTVAPGLAYTQANADTLSGQIRSRDGGTRMNFTFGTNFRAWDRYRRFDRFPSLPFFNTRFFDTRGGIQCTSGTNFSVTVNFLFDFTFNANGLLGC